jgi:hypothetical protein
VKRRQQVEELSKIPRKIHGLRRIVSGLFCQRTRKGIMAVKSAASKATTKKRASSKRELINTGTDKRFVRRDGAGRFKESDDVGRSLAADRRQHAKTKAKPGQGDRGDR